MKGIDIMTSYEMFVQVEEMESFYEDLQAYFNGEMQEEEVID